MLVVVYILRCADGSYYVGNTRKTIEARLWEHNHGLVPGYTATRRPVERPMPRQLKASRPLLPASGNSKVGRAARRRH